MMKKILLKKVKKLKLSNKHKIKNKIKEKKILIRIINWDDYLFRNKESISSKNSLDFNGCPLFLNHHIFPIISNKITVHPIDKFKSIFNISNERICQKYNFYISQRIKEVNGKFSSVDTKKSVRNHMFHSKFGFVFYSFLLSQHVKLILLNHLW